MSRHFPALRGLAIFLVVINHAITLSLQAVRESGLGPVTRWQTITLVSIKNVGLVAVPIFLFLSGAYIVYATRGKSWGAAYRTVVLGLRYVLTAYLLWSCIFYVMLFLLTGQTDTAAGYLRDLVVGYPFNFVPILVFFYLLAPVLVRLAERSSIALLVGVLIYQLASANIMAPGILGFELPAWARWITIPGLRLSMAIWAVFFPLGLVYGLNSEAFTQTVRSLTAILSLLTLAAYAVTVLHDLSVLTIAVAELLFPILAIPLLATLARDQVPKAAWLEGLGRMAYGLYLTNLISLNLLLFAVGRYAIGWMVWPITLVPILAVLTIWLMRLAVRALSQSRWPSVQRYVFG